MKKALSLMLTMCMVLSLFATFVVSASADNVVTWKDGQINDPADTNPDDGQNLKFDNAYGYTFAIEADKKIGGEDNALIETVDEYKACNPNWAISVLLKPAGDLYEVVTVVATPGSADKGIENGIVIENGNIVLVAHSAYSHEEGANFEGKLCALALKAGDKVKVADDKSSVYVLIPGVDDKEEVTGPVISETTILSTGKSYTATAPNRGDNFDDNGTKLTNGVKGLEDAGTIETAGWNNSDKSTANVVEVVVDLGASVLSNSYVVYIAGGNWGIGLPTEGTSVEVFASDSADSGFTSVAAAGKADMVLKSGDGEALNAWSTYTLTANAAAPVQARYIKFVITAEPIGNAFIWMDEVEVVAVKTESSSTVVKEEITVDGDLNDNGWAKDKWIVVDHETGYLQNTYEIQQGTAVAADFGYKYQLRTDDTKLYGAIVVDGAPVAGGNGKGTFPRLWIRDNDEATIYTHFFNIEFDANGNVITGAKYNTSTTENKGANIENSTFVAFAKEVDGKTVFEFSVDIKEFCADGTFDYFLSVSQLAGENYGCLYHPASEIGPTDPNGGANHIPHKYLPFNTWHTAKDATINVKDIALGEIVVSDKEEADTSMMGTAPADPAFTVTLNTEKGWKAGEKLVVTATVDVLKDGVDLSQIMFNLFYDAADVEIVLPEELGDIITTGKDSWKEDSLFTLSVDGDYGVIECAPATAEKEEDVLKKGDKLVMTFEFTVKDEAEGLINFQLSNNGLVGYSWDLDAAEVAGAGSSLAVVNADNLGDTGIYVIAALALVALIGTAIVIKKRA